MAANILIDINGRILKAELNDSAAAGDLAAKLPMTISMNRWGDEYYGGCGLRPVLDETARDIMEIGELAVWPSGSALCIFFGPTPASTDDRPKAASDVMPIGRVTSGLQQLKELGSSISAEIKQK